MTEEKTALEEYRKSQDKLLEEQEDKKKKELLGTSSSLCNKVPQHNKNKQTKLLQGAVIKRQVSSEKELNRQSSEEPPSKKEKTKSKISANETKSCSALTALGSYDSSSDSDNQND